MDQIKPWLEVIQAIGAAVSALAWLIIAVLFARLLPQIRALAANVEELRIDGPLNTNFSFKVKQTAEYLEKVAIERLGASESKNHNNTDDRVRRFTDLLKANPTSIDGARILWVDDKPRNNRREERAFRMLGAEVERSLDTDAAVERLAHEQFDVIISDMGRPSDARAGYALLKILRNRGDNTPFLIYSTSNNPKHNREALDAGAQGSTNDPRILTAMVITQLQMPDAT